MKKGSASANTFGSVAVIYSAFGVLLSWARGTDDELNTIIAATASGCLYKSTGNLFLSSLYNFICTTFITAGLRKCGMGGAIGLAASSLYALWNSREKLAQLRQLNPA